MLTRLTRRAVIAGVAAAPLFGPQALGVSDVTPQVTLRAGGVRRTYRLVKPQSLGEKPPLVLAFHGMGIDSISLMPAYSGLDDLAREKGFLLAYPASYENHWPLSFGPKLRRELAFFDALVNKLVRETPCDPSRIYLMGMSNGGYFINVLAQQRGKYIAGLAVHSGSAGVLAMSGIKSPRKFPVYVAHGDADPILGVQNGRDCAALYEREGHKVAYDEIKGLGHIWAKDQGVNARIWAHLTSNPVPA